MSCVAGGKLLSILGFSINQQINTRYNQLFTPFLQVRNYAARKGTREKARKKKVKVEVKKVGFIPHNLRVKKEDFIRIDRLRYDDDGQTFPTDDVWLRKYHKTRIFSFEEAIECHRETHHPTCYGLPNAFVYATFDLDMQGEKVGKLVEGFIRSVNLPHQFDHGEVRNIIAFSKHPELNQLADEAGAVVSGGSELIGKIQTGEVSLTDIQFAVAHPQIMSELSPIKGLLKKKFPSPRAGTLGIDLAAMVLKIRNAIKYSVRPHERQPAFGVASVPIGLLSMDIKELEANAIAVMQDVNKAKPKRPEPFITKVCLTSPPSPELLKIDHKFYLESDKKRDTSYDSDEEEEVSVFN